ncbi:hypothetical protein [Methylocystis echinoides]|uniref:Transglycosylase SLT domain-containing protein n=1 Tax=Methylocystis echinoides TaxID=29468 RepID=A0A9W6LTB6_9HYPH|nr:hypothetical protein [Methylocystis echinoides]GLI94326.1 hypothetical protein LMG27198_33180 [Methylocystis echinoides]
MTETPSDLPATAPESVAESPAPAETAAEAKAEKPAVEIRISLGSDQKELLQLLSALKLQETLSAPAAPKPQERPASQAPTQVTLVAPLIGEPLAPVSRKEKRRRNGWLSPLMLVAALALGFALHTQIDLTRLVHHADASRTLVDYIVGVESAGDATAKNPYSSALGLGQFVEATWLDLIRRHHPEIAASRNEREILEMRKDPELSRFLTSRYVEENTSILTRKGLAATPGALYLAHFAGPGGAVAILTAPENANAAEVIANVDSRLSRDKIVNGNPFLKNFTARDLKNWAELKMQGLTLVEGEGKVARRDL